MLAFLEAVVASGGGIPVIVTGFLIDQLMGGHRNALKIVATLSAVARLATVGQFLHSASQRNAKAPFDPFGHVLKVYIFQPEKKSAFRNGVLTEGAFAKGHDGRKKDGGGGSGDSGGVPGAAVDCGVYCGSDEPSGAQGKASAI